MGFEAPCVERERQPFTFVRSLTHSKRQRAVPPGALKTLDRKVVGREAMWTKPHRQLNTLLNTLFSSTDHRGNIVETGRGPTLKCD